MTTKSASKTTAKPRKKAKATTKKTASKKTATASKASAKPKTAAKVKSAPKKAPRTAKPKMKKGNGNGKGTEVRASLIEQTAYFIAEKRGFQGGDPVQDWLAAERQVDEMLKEQRT